MSQSPLEAKTVPSSSPIFLIVGRTVRLRSPAQPVDAICKYHGTGHSWATVVSQIPRIRLTGAGLVVSCLSLILPVMAQEKFLLRSHWVPGKVYTQQTETQTTSLLTPVDGPALEQKLNVTQTTTLKVAQDPSGPNKLADVTFTAVTGEMSFAGQTHRFDSAEPLASHPLLRKALGGAVGKSFVLVFDGEDQFLDVKATEKLAGDGTTITGLGAVADAREVANLFRRSLDMGLSTRMPVGPGDRWTSEESLNFPQSGPVKVLMNSKFEEVLDREGRRHAKVVFDGKISTARNPQPDAARQPAEVEVGADSTVAGHVFFDLERRTVSLAVFLSNLSLNLSGHRIPIRQQVTTRLLSISDAP